MVCSAVSVQTMRFVSVVDSSDVEDFVSDESESGDEEMLVGLGERVARDVIVDGDDFNDDDESSSSVEEVAFDELPDAEPVAATVPETGIGKPLMGLIACAEDDCICCGRASVSVVKVSARRVGGRANIERIFGDGKFGFEKLEYADCLCAILVMSRT